MPWRPTTAGEVPTLGWGIIDWISEFLAAPDRGEYEPFRLYPEQEDFVLRFYELDPRTCKRRYRRGVLSRPRGWGKSPFLAALACAEALGEVVPDGWDADGQPVGKPWASVRTPLVQIAAVSETQTKNTWSPLLEMLDGPAIDAYPGLEPMETFVNLPRGRIETVTSSARTIKGNRAVFAVLDQTEEWVKSNNGLRLAETMRINAAKVGGHTVESPNAYIPGEGSVAENSAEFWKAIQEGRTLDDGLYYDHREAPATTKLNERKSLIAGLKFAYGDSADVNGGHVELDGLVSTVWDTSTGEQTARADFLNQITHASDSYLAASEWGALADATKVVADGDTIVLGFDGSVREDSTALVACRVSDGHLWIPEYAGVSSCWEKPDGPAGDTWQVDRVAVDAVVSAMFDRYKVIGLYADPAHWQDTLDRWQSEFGPRIRVRASAHRPLEWWTNRPKYMVDALERFHSAVLGGEFTHDGGSVLTRHILNARNRLGRSGMTIAKEHPHSSRKIDAAMAAVLAYECRADAVTAGFARKRTRRKAYGF